MSPRTLADPGGICISATVYEHVRRKLPYPFENRGERALKNIVDPVGSMTLGPENIASLPCDDPHPTCTGRVLAGVRRPPLQLLFVPAALWALSSMSCLGETTAVKARLAGRATHVHPPNRGVRPTHRAIHRSAAVYKCGS